MTQEARDRASMPRLRMTLTALFSRLPSVPVIVFLVVMMAVPVLKLLSLSVYSPGHGFQPRYYEHLFASPVYVRVLWITVQLSLVSTLVAVVLAYPVAFVIATSNDKTKARLYFLVLIPFWTSFLVRALAWVVLLARHGAINAWIRALGLSDVPLSMIYNAVGALIGTAQAMLPMAIMILVATMDGIDPTFEQASKTLGSGRGSTFWRVFFPLSLPGVTSAALLVFLTSLGFFITPSLLGGRHEVVITQLIISQVQEMLDWPFAGAISVLLLVCAGVIFYFYDRLVGFSSLGGAAQASTSRASGPWRRGLDRVGIALLGALGKMTDDVLRLFAWIFRRSPHHPNEGRPAWLAWRAASWVVLFFACAPIFIMVPISFTEKSILDWPAQGFSLQWYAHYFSSTQWLSATVTSFSVALFSALLTLVLVIPAAFVLVRTSWWGKRGVISLLLAPMVVPRIIIAVALFYFYSTVGLVGTQTGLILGHAVLSIPYALVGIVTVLRDYDQRLDQAAATMGAGRLTTFFRITLPLIRFGVLSAFLLSFATSFDDLTVSLFVTGGLTTTLPKQMWDDATLQVTPVLAAVSTLIIVFMLLILLCLEWSRRRSGASLKKP